MQNVNAKSTKSNAKFLSNEIKIVLNKTHIQQTNKQTKKKQSKNIPIYYHNNRICP